MTGQAHDSPGGLRPLPPRRWWLVPTAIVALALVGAVLVQPGSDEVAVDATQDGADELLDDQVNRLVGQLGSDDPTSPATDDTEPTTPSGSESTKPATPVTASEPDETTAVTEVVVETTPAAQVQTSSSELPSTGSTTSTVTASTPIETTTSTVATTAPTTAAPTTTSLGGCDPNYAGACVPIASDVDCAGGSGDGPAYVQGPVQVVGSDIYGLDHDDDGIGCET